MPHRLKPAITAVWDRWAAEAGTAALREQLAKARHQVQNEFVRRRAAEAQIGTVHQRNTRLQQSQHTAQNVAKQQQSRVLDLESQVDALKQQVAALKQEVAYAAARGASRAASAPAATAETVLTAPAALAGVMPLAALALVEAEPAPATATALPAPAPAPAPAHGSAAAAETRAGADAPLARQAALYAEVEALAVSDDVATAAPTVGGDASPARARSG